MEATPPWPPLSRGQPEGPGRGAPLDVACLTWPMTLTLGYKASAEQFTPRDLVEYAVLAEEVGLDSVVVSDHFQPWRHTGGHAPF